MSRLIDNRAKFQQGRCRCDTSVHSTPLPVCLWQLKPLLAGASLGFKLLTARGGPFR
jgi:hypothetical protein